MSDDGWLRRAARAVRALGWKPPVAVAAAIGILSAPWWGPPLLSHLAYFRVRHVEIVGERYIEPRDVLTRLRVDTATSIWTDLAPLEQRVASLPQVRAAHIERNLPGTLVVHITENVPVAFVPSPSGLRAVDASGRTLPIDPSEVGVDVPVVPRADHALLALLDAVRQQAPGLFARISSVQRSGRDELTIELPTERVRAEVGVTAGRLTDIIPVERDLARRQLHAAELDLRFRDQVIARLQ
ncbi:MAG: cell division protein FtsQ/DivIB [Gemmatimonadaceae bacterium]